MLVFAMLIAAVSPETDQPHRDWGKVAVIDMPITAAQACVAREMDAKGSVLVLPVENGAEIDFSFPGGPFGDYALDDTNRCG